MYPLPEKNLFWNYTQCSLRECRKHSITSMPTSTPNDTETKIANATTN